MDRPRISVIGAGSMGRKHAALINASGECELIGVCDIDPAAEASTLEFGASFYNDIDALLETERPDAAIIATPNSEHASCAETCAARSIHLLIEKPVADTPDAARRIEVAADTGGISVLVGHHRRHNPLVAAARAIVRGTEIGSLVGVSMLWTLYKPESYSSVEWRRRRPGGGPVLINLIHELDSLPYICGEISEVYACTNSKTRGLEVEDSFSVSLAFESGAVGTIIGSDTAASPWSYEITTGENPYYHHTKENCCYFLGTRGSLVFPRMELWRFADEAAVGWQHPMEKTAIDVTKKDPLEEQLKHFCQVIRGDEKPLTNTRDGGRSLAAGRPVTLPPAG